MMNVLALSLVLMSLITGGVFTPPKADKGDVIVKDGHRVVVVEYDNGDGTKVSISPEGGGVRAVGDVVSDAAEKAKGGVSGPRELVCDAFGKCVHKIVGTFGKTKEAVAEKAHRVEEKIGEVKDTVSDKVHETLGGCKDTVTGKAHDVKEAMSGKAHDVKESVAEKAHDVEEQTKDRARDVKEAASDAMHRVVDKINGVREQAKDEVGKVKDTFVEKVPEKAKEGLGKVEERVAEVVGKSRAEKAKELAKDSAKRIGEDIEHNVSSKFDSLKEQTKEEGKKSFGEIMRKGRDVVNEMFEYAFAAERVGPFFGVIHLLGFSTAYGMCLWVTFASSYILARVLPQQQFAMVQSKLYHVYFMAMAYSIAVVMLGFLSCQRGRVVSELMELFQASSLFSALSMVLVNLYYLEPQATKVMFERMKIEKEEGRGLGGDSRGGVADEVGDPVSRPKPASSETVDTERGDIQSLNLKIKKLNTSSSLLNAATLVVLTWHLVYHRLQVTY